MHYDDLGLDTLRDKPLHHSLDYTYYRRAIPMGI